MGALTKIYFLTLSTFLFFDAIWLGVISKNFYKEQLGYIMRENFLIVPALIFYIAFALALIVFVIYPALKVRSLKNLLISAAFFGFITYATYDLTNYSLVKDWPLVVTIIDLFWGATVATLVSWVVYIVSNRFNLLHN